MAAIRTEEITYCTPAKLHVIPGGRDGSNKTRDWHPSMGSRSESRQPAGESGPRSSSKSPNYALRRLVIALAAITLLTGLFWGVETIAFSASPVSSGTEYIVKPGDTLWSIAHNHAPNSDPRRTVEAIRTLNGIGADIRPGQQILLPA